MAKGKTSSGKKKSPDDIIRMAREKKFSNGRERAEMVLLAQLELLAEIRDAVKG